VLQKEKLDKGAGVRISILGLTYKENTHSIKNSPAINFIKNLRNFKVSAYDPCAPMNAVSHDILRVSSARDALLGADVLVVATAWPEFVSLSVDEICGAMDGKVIVDPYKVLDGVKLKSLGFSYYSLGNANQFTEP
jgi:UDPglucose 6-dehydrogenase